MPGALTPTEIVTAWTAGADFVKVFPAGALGGTSYVKSLKAPLPEIEMIPTGGVSLQNAADFIKAGAIAVGVGTDLVDLNALREGNEKQLTVNGPSIPENRPRGATGSLNRIGRPQSALTSASEEIFVPKRTLLKERGD